MYHDQGLPVLKHAGFGEAVNVTLGLPIVRTSVDHGTALDLAGSGRADAGSLLRGDRAGRADGARGTGGRVMPRPQALRPAFPARSGGHRAHRAPRSICSPGDAAVEIGPGQGALTARLLAAAGQLDAIEIDRDLAAALRERLRSAAALRRCTRPTRCEFDWRALAAARGARLRVIGNLPYNISTPLLFRLLGVRGRIIDMHFMLQKEVVDRIVAAPGSGDYGRLAVMLAPRADAHGACSMSAPARSGLRRGSGFGVRAPGRARRAAGLGAAPAYGAVVAAAFGQRRKTLRNALRRYLSAEQIARCGIDPGARAETLSAAQFGALAQAARRCASLALSLRMGPSPVMTAYRRILAAIDLTEEQPRRGRTRLRTRARSGRARCSCCTWSSSCRSNR